MDETDLLPRFRGALCHDYWKNDGRMTKVRQKISGCFRCMVGALVFYRIRGYRMTRRKQGVTDSEALRLFFEGKLPDFVLEFIENCAE